ncbi:MAG: DedA family protein [Acidimicrobiales bacterium]|nr:DedA family protein [Acidimicrobiales bacterium]
MFDDLGGTVSDAVERFGYLAVALLVALESVFPPIPSEAVLPVAGFVAGRGDASILGMLLAATVGSVVGAWILYGLSAAVGPVRLRAFVARHGRWFGMKPHHLERAEDWFATRRDAAVLIGRCVPLIRSIVSIPAGFQRMPFLRFTALSAAGSLVWNAALIGAGAVLGDRWHRVGDVMGLVQGVLLLLAGAGAVFLLWQKVLRPRLAARGDLPPLED